MSTFEERLEQLNLTPFKNQRTGTKNEIKRKLFEEFVKQLWKYQYFKNKVVLEKVNRAHYSPCTVKNYMAYLRTYLQHNKKHRGAGVLFYQLLDEFKSRFEPVLTPSKYDRHAARGAYKPRKCVPEILLPEEKKEYKYIEVEEASDKAEIYISEDVVEAVKSYLTPACQSFGVLCENKIIMFDSKEYCLGFIDCYKTVGDGKEVKLIKMNYEVIDENN